MAVSVSASAVDASTPMDVDMDMDQDHDHDQEDFVPDSLKDFLAEADAALNKILSDDIMDDVEGAGTAGAGGGVEPSDDDDDDPSMSISILRDQHNKKNQPARPQTRRGSRSVGNVNGSGNGNGNGVVKGDKEKSKISDPSSISTRTRSRTSTSKTTPIPKLKPSTRSSKSLSKSTPKITPRKTTRSTLSTPVSASSASKSKTKTKSRLVPSFSSSSPAMSIASSMSIATPSPIGKDLSKTFSASTSMEDDTDTPSSMVEDHCRPNPATLYNTTAEAREIALDDNPSVCPDHGDSCACHLIPRPPVFNMNLGLDMNMEGGGCKVVVEEERGKKNDDEYETKETKEEEEEETSTGTTSVTATTTTRTEVKAKKNKKQEQVEVKDMEKKKQQQEEEKNKEKKEVVASAASSKAAEKKKPANGNGREGNGDKPHSDSKSQKKNKQKQQVKLKDVNMEKKKKRKQQQQQQQQQEEKTKKKKEVAVEKKKPANGNDREGNGDRQHSQQSNSQSQSRVASASASVSLQEVEFFPLPQRLTTIPSGDTDLSFDDDDGGDGEGEGEGGDNHTNEADEFGIGGYERKDLGTFLSTSKSDGNHSTTAAQDPDADADPHAHADPDDGDATMDQKEDEEEKDADVDVDDVEDSGEQVMNKENEGGTALNVVKAAIPKKIHRVIKQQQQPKPQQQSIMKTKTDLNVNINTERRKRRVGVSSDSSSAGALTRTRTRTRTSTATSRKAPSPSSKSSPLVKPTSRPSRPRTSGSGVGTETEASKLRARARSKPTAIITTATGKVTVTTKGSPSRTEEAQTAKAASLSRLHSMLEIIQEKRKKDPKDMKVRPPPTSSAASRRMRAMSGGGSVGSASVSVGSGMSTHPSRKALTQPKGFRLRSQDKNGERKYSNVGLRDTTVSLAQEKQAAAAVPPSHKVDWKKRELTVPRAPKFKSVARHGERVYSTVGAEDEETRQRKREEKVKDELLRKSDWKKRVPTKAKAPRLATEEKLGERKYAVVGSREEEIELMVEEPPRVVDWKNRKLTEPKAPRLSSSARHGERKYATVGPRNDKVVEEEQPRIIDWKNRKLTEPKAPRLSCSARLGERVYATAGPSRDGEEVEIKPQPKIDWKNRKLTVPRAPRLSVSNKSDELTIKPKDEKSVQFKARPIGKGVMSGSGNVGVKKIPKRTLTTAAPFALSSRIQKKEIPEEPKKKINNFKARPIPKFSATSLSPERRAKYRRPPTESKPFNLKTIERALSPKEKRREKDTKLHAFSPVKSPKKRPLTTPKPFQLGDRSAQRLQSAKAKESSPTPMAPPVMTRITRESGAISSVFPLADSVRKCQTWNEPNSKPIRIERTLSEDVTQTLNALRVQTDIPSTSLPKPPASDPPKKRKVVTTQRPFRLSTTNQKSKENGKVSGKSEGSFRARPMPSFKEPKKAAPRRRLTTPKPFRLSSRTDVEKVEVEEEIDQKLAMRSKQSATDRGKQFEETQGVVDKLEQLNSSLSLPMDKCQTTESDHHDSVAEDTELNGPLAQPQDPEESDSAGLPTGME